MKSKIAVSIRWKLIWTFILSALLSFITISILLSFAYMLYREHLLQSLFRNLAHRVGIVPIASAVGILFFVLFFFLLTQRTIRYLEVIFSTLGQMEEGNLDARIPVRSSDELGQLAERINHMAGRLKSSMEEERNAERAKNDLITSVSHDLRTPLTSILGYLGLIVGNRYKDETEIQYYADIAYHKSKKLKRLIDELFEFTRITFGGLKIKPKSIDLGEMLEQLGEEFYPMLQETGMKFQLSLPPEKVFVLADGNLLARVFDNLVTNAVRYGEEGKAVDAVIRPAGRQIEVEITNYGPPIPQHELPYIFDKFYRVEHSRSRDTGGTGLGLAIAKNIVDLHGGSITARSGVDGTTFKIILPAA